MQRLRSSGALTHDSSLTTVANPEGPWYDANVEVYDAANNTNPTSALLGRANVTGMLAVSPPSSFAHSSLCMASDTTPQPILSLRGKSG